MTDDYVSMTGTAILIGMGLGINCLDKSMEEKKNLINGKIGEASKKLESLFSQIEME